MLAGKRVAFIGGGNMAEALLKGFLGARLFSSQSLCVSDVREDRLAFLAQAYGVGTTPDNVAAARQADILLLAVKPQVIRPVLEGLRQVVSPAKLLVSIAAGVPTTVLEDQFAHPVRVVRVMPNTPALVQEGASALARGRHATEEDLALAQQLFSAVGTVVVVGEPLMDAVTGLSGSGPAYVFVIIEALADAGVRAGLPREVAQMLAAQTVRGAARMVLETGKHPGVLKDMVASPWTRQPAAPANWAARESPPVRHPIERDGMFLLANFIGAVARLLDLAIWAYGWIVVARALVSWVNADPWNPIVQFLHRATEPVLAPIRRRLPGWRLGVDLSPMVVILALYFAEWFLVASLQDLAGRLR